MTAIDAGTTASVLSVVSALVSALVPIAICMAAGAAARRCDSGWPGADMLVGFGLLGGALTILAVATPVPLSWLMTALAVLSLTAAAVRRQMPGGRSTWIALALVAPILVHAAGEQAALYDEFWHWLPNAAYAFTHGSFLKRGLAPSFSELPAYPQAMPLMIAAASSIAGRFLEAAGPVINVALLAGVSALLAEALAAALERQGRLLKPAMPVFLVAAAVAVTFLNPGLDGSVVLSSYADCATIVAVGALGLLGVEILTRIAGRGPGNTEGLAWRFGLVAALLVNLKQANPVLLALLVSGLTALALRDPAVAKRRALVQLPRMLGPAIIVFAAWRWYVIVNAPQGEAGFRPFGSWNFQAVPKMLVNIWKQLTEAPLFHAMMWMVTVAGVSAFFTLRHKPSEAKSLAVVCATVWLGYNVFLLVIYLGSFDEYEAETAAQYWRYASHAALLGVYAPVMALALGRRPAWVGWGRTAYSLAAVPLALCVLPLRSDLNNPPGRPLSRFIRNATTDLRRAIPPGAKVVIVRHYEGLFDVILRYDLWQLGAPERQIYWTGWTTYYETDPAGLARLAREGKASYLVIQDRDTKWDKVETDKLGLPAIDHEVALFAWREDAWEKVQSWPIPERFAHGGIGFE